MPRKSRGGNIAARRKKRNFDRRSRPRRSSSRPALSSHPLQEHADVGGQYTTVAVQECQRGVTHLAVTGPSGHLQMRLDQMRHGASNTAMAIAQETAMGVERP